jgi:hypothetical protein
LPAPADASRTAASPSASVGDGHGAFGGAIGPPAGSGSPRADGASAADTASDTTAITALAAAVLSGGPALPGGTAGRGQSSPSPFLPASP